MTGTIDLTKALSDEVIRLEKVLARNIKVGETPPGESQIASIKALIADLKGQIGQTNG